MKSLLSSDHVNLVRALNQDSFEQQLRTAPNDGIAALKVKLADRKEALNEATTYFGGASAELAYVHQLAVTACDDECEATTTISTDAADPHC